MKKYLCLLPIFALAFAGCNEDDLDIAEKGAIAMDKYYKTDADAEAALAGMYSDTHKNFAKSDAEYNFSPIFGLTNFQDDDIYLAGSGADDCVSQREYEQFRYTDTNPLVEAAYTAFYRSIHKCNLVINNFTVEKLGSISNVMKRCVAEARVMRAYDHMMLGIYWNRPAIVEEVLETASHPASAESQAAIMDWVAKEIDLALPDLDERKSTTDKEGAVKVTKGFAYAIKGKALLWKKDYEGAKTALKAVISSGKYALVPTADLHKLLHADGKATSEAVFEFNFVSDKGVVIGNNAQLRTGWNDHMTFNWRFENLQGGNFGGDKDVNNNGWGWLNPTGKFANDLIANDGNDSERRKVWIKSYSELLNNFQWASDSILNENDTTYVYKNEKGEEVKKEVNRRNPRYSADQLKELKLTFVRTENIRVKTKDNDFERGIGGNVNFIYGNEGFFNWKTVVHKSQGDINSINGGWDRNRSLMRYAEVLLLYAEACAMTSDEDGLGLKGLQDIQNRAGSDHVSTALTLEEVQNEKRFELWLEGCRSADLIRWKKTETLEKQGFYVPNLRDAFVDKTSTVHKAVIDESGAAFYKNKYGENIGFKKGKHEFLPFPRVALDLNPNLVQNPGW